MPKDSGPLICIVDDDASNRKALSRLLSLKGLQVRCFGSGEDFVAYARSHNVHLVILDACTPGTSGLEVQARLNRVSPGCHVIMMTARNDNAVRPAAAKGVASDFFLKLFDNERLLRAVHNALAADDTF